MVRGLKIRRPQGRVGSSPTAPTGEVVLQNSASFADGRMPSDSMPNLSGGPVVENGEVRRVRQTWSTRRPRAGSVP